MSLRNLACVGWVSFVLGSGCAVGSGEDAAAGKKADVGGPADAAIPDTPTDGVVAPDVGGTDLGSADADTPSTDSGVPDTDPLDVGSTETSPFMRPSTSGTATGLKTVDRPEMVQEIAPCKPFDRSRNVSSLFGSPMP
jgi:hypothetical protein